MGKHSGKRDPQETTERPGAYVEGESVERTVSMFDWSVGSAVTAVADKRLSGTYPYDQEPGNKGTVDSRGVRRNDTTERRRKK